MNGYIKAVVAGIVVLGATFGGFYYWQQRSTDTVAAAVVVDSTKYKYKDGTYSADGSYGTPGGTENINVSVTLSNGTITSTEVTNKANNDVSKNYQNRFSSAYKTQVIGKSLESVQLRAVSGSSLTPKGFMTALENIKTQAKS